MTTTPVRAPVVKDAWVKPGTHINAIGPDAAGKQELEISLLRRSRVGKGERTAGSSQHNHTVVLIEPQASLTAPRDGDALD